MKKLITIMAVLFCSLSSFGINVISNTTQSERFDEVWYARTTMTGPTTARLIYVKAEQPYFTLALRGWSAGYKTMYYSDDEGYIKIGTTRKEAAEFIDLMEQFFEAADSGRLLQFTDIAGNYVTMRYSRYAGGRYIFFESDDLHMYSSPYMYGLWSGFFKKMRREFNEYCDKNNIQ